LQVYIIYRCLGLSGEDMHCGVDTLRSKL